MYSHEPSYEWTSFTSCPGIISSALTVLLITFYVGVTLRDFIVVAPELVKQGTHALPDVVDELRLPLPPQIGIGVSYKDVAWKKHKVTAANADSYFTLKFTHKTIEEQDRKPRTYKPMAVVDCSVGGSDAICPAAGDGADHKLQGTYVKPKYEYVEINVAKCENSTVAANRTAPGANAFGCPEGHGPTPVAGRCHRGPVCAPPAHIAHVVAIGEVKVQLTVVVQNFDPGAMHEGGTGVTSAARGWRCPSRFSAEHCCVGQTHCIA